MRRLVDILRDHLREDFEPGYYGAIALFLAAALALNFHLDFKRQILDPSIANPSGILYFGLFYGLAYCFAVFAWALFHREARLLRSPAVWAISGFVILSMALDNYSANLPSLLVGALEVPGPLQHLARQSLWNVDRTIAIAIPVVAFRLLVDRDKGSFYGLTWAGFEWRPYAFMLLVMAPIVAWASFQPPFLDAYPTYRVGPAEAHLSLSHATSFGVYETTYALRIVTVELFFRGLLVLGLEKYLGRAALMPMVSVYAFWHFAKPLPEAIGSIFAAYILGVCALRTRSIAGAIIVHVSVALLMELAAYLQAFAFGSAS